jgi:rod shape-determining protein MreD
MNRELVKRIALWALTITGVLVLESKVRLVGIKLNLLVLFAYFAGLRYGPARGLLSGAALGVIADSITGGMLGPRMFSLGTVGYLASFLTGRLFTWTPMLGFFAVAILCWIDGLLAYGSLVVFGSAPTTMGHALTVVFWQGAMNAFLGPCIRPGDES